MSDATITADCLTCGTPIEWWECPTGGWWSHVTHPADDHDAETQVEVDERMDDNGYWHTVGVKAVES